MILFIMISMMTFAGNKDENRVEGSHSKGVIKKESITELKTKKERKSLTDLRDEIRKISQKINARRRSLYKEDEEIKNLQNQISDLQKKVNQVISNDKEYTELMKSRQKLREELNIHYKSRRSSNRMSRPGGSGRPGMRTPRNLNKKSSEMSPAGTEADKK